MSRVRRVLDDARSATYTHLRGEEEDVMLATIYRGGYSARPAWIRVAPNPEAWCRAIAALVRPDEVAHLVERVPAQYLPGRRTVEAGCRGLASPSQRAIPRI
jgi:hypothetical protein